VLFELANALLVSNKELDESAGLGLFEPLGLLLMGLSSFVE
jgi:hypothetical protein